MQLNNKYNFFLIGNFGVKNFEKNENFSVKNSLKIGNFDRKIKNFSTLIFF